MNSNIIFPSCCNNYGVVCSETTENYPTRTSIRYTLNKGTSKVGIL